MTFEADLHRHYSGVRHRLRGTSPPAIRRDAFIALVTREEREAEAAEKASIPEDPVKLRRLRKIDRMISVARAMRATARRRAEIADRVVDGYQVGRRSFIPLSAIAGEVAYKHGVTIDDIKGPRRVKKIMAARVEFYIRAANETSKSYPQIGRFCGGRDHTTILKVVKSRMGVPESRG